jgi:hypothetical protein
VEVRVLLFRALLVLILVALASYTAIVVANYGWNFFPTAFDEMFALTWQKQFNLDFMGYLILSAVWTAWRHHFSPIGLLLAVVAFFGGMIFLTVYLLVASFQVKGDVKALMLGTKRANA